MNPHHKRIAIVGGGITGLAAAFHARSVLPDADIILLEAGDRLGGVLQTDQVGGYLVEQSADMFTTDPSFALELCQTLGKTDELIGTVPTKDRAFVATENAIHPVPRGLSLMSPGDLDAVLDSPLLDEAAKQRFVQEETAPISDWVEDESLESFAVRRFGRSAFERLIQPLVSGIYTADPAKLSMKATMARFVDMELGHGSLIRAAANLRQQSVDREASGARYGLFRAPKNGIGQLVQWLTAALTDVDLQTNCNVVSISRSETAWAIQLERARAASQLLSVDGIILAIPALSSARLVGSFDRALSSRLLSIEAASAAIVVLGIDRSQLKSNFQGYGIIVPTILNRKIIACSFSSNKFSHRAPDGKLLVRCFIGGALQGELVELGDDELIRITSEELTRMLGYAGSPEIARVYRWRNCMPQYHLGHLDRVQEIESLASEHSGLELAGNSYRGVGIPACIQSGFEATDRLVRHFGKGR
jgi:oxygen-dependent protoporphyrinogen oxidase